MDTIKYYNKLTELIIKQCKKLIFIASAILSFTILLTPNISFQKSSAIFTIIVGFLTISIFPFNKYKEKKLLNNSILTIVIIMLILSIMYEIWYLSNNQNNFTKKTYILLSIFSATYVIVISAINIYSKYKIVNKNYKEINNLIKDYYRSKNITNFKNIKKNNLKEIYTQELQSITTNIYETKEINFIAYYSNFKTSNREDLILYIQKQNGEYIIFGDNSKIPFSKKYENHTIISKWGSLIK